MRLELRPTTSADLYAVSRLEQTLTGRTRPGRTGIAWHRAVLADPAQEHLVVTEGRRVAGFLVLLDGPRRTLELRRIVVRVDLQGRGVDGALLRAALQRARERGRRRLVTGVARDQKATRDLYEANGFDVLALPSPFVAFDVPDGVLVMSRTVGGAAAGRRPGRRPGSPRVARRR